MGLLDGSDLDDDTRSGLLSAGFGLLSTPGSLRQGLGTAGLLGAQAYQQNGQNRLATQVKQLQIGEMQAQAQAQVAARSREIEKQRLLSTLGPDATPDQAGRLLFANGFQQEGLSILKDAGGLRKTDAEIAETGAKTADIPLAAQDRARTGERNDFLANNTYRDTSSQIGNRDVMGRVANWNASTGAFSAKEAARHNLVTEGQGDSRIALDAQVAAAKAATEKQPTKEQAKVGGFAVRAQQADDILSKADGGAIDGASFSNNLSDRAPTVGKVFDTVGLSNKSKEFKQAADNLVMASLRDESGAVIGTKEYWDQYRLLIPQTGDPESVLAQKKAAREAVKAGLAVGAGPALPQVQGRVSAATQSGRAPISSFINN